MPQNTLPLNYEIVVYSGTSFKREFRWYQDGTTPVNFTGWKALMLVGNQQAQAVVELSTENGGITLTADGRITMLMTPAQTMLFKPPLVYYNFDLIEPDGFVRRFLRGRVSVVVDVKQP